MNLIKHNQKLAYLILKVAASVRREELRKKLEKWPFELLENTALEKYDEALMNIGVLEYFINFGRMIYEIEPINAEIVIKELSTANSAIRQYMDLIKLPNYSEGEETLPNSVDKFGNDFENVSIFDDFEGNNSAIRQSEVLERIRQFGNNGCQIRDIMVEFPKVSERTLRNDINKLLARDLIDRIGSTGPGTSYVVKTIRT